jgi:dihydroorotate dehydrogenase (fumarate)
MMMDLSTRYLGMTLPHPLIVGASPLADDLDGVKRLEDAGAAAIVFRSLFEEQITLEQMSDVTNIDYYGESSPEAASYFPSPHAFALGPFQYLELVRRAKAAVAIPIVASLNGTTPGGWIEYARLMAEAGADALELNLYRVATDPDTSSAQIEQQMVDTVKQVKAAVTIPIAVKLSPFFAGLAHLARELDRVGADGLVLFNRFYQPDINAEDLTAVRTLHLSDSSELLLRLHWMAILSGHVQASLAVTGGVHTALDVVKATMAGAHVTQMVSALLRNGPAHLRTVLNDLSAWLEKNDWSSLAEMRGNMNLFKVPDPEAYERANYMLMLQSWRG